MNSRRGLRWLVAVAASFVAMPGIGAVADPAQTSVTTIDGRMVGVGDVIGAGEQTGGTCVFSTPVGVVLTTPSGAADESGAAGTTLRITDDCQVIVAAIDIAASTDLSSAPIGRSTEPKHPGDVADVMPLVGGSTSVFAVVDRLAKDPPKPDDVELWTATVYQTFYNRLGQFQWEDSVGLDYAQHTGTREVVNSAPDPIINYCTIYVLDPTTTYANEKGNCVRHHTAKSGPYAEVEGSGDYRQMFLGLQLAAGTAKEVLTVTKTNVVRECHLPLTLPADWTAACRRSTS